MDHLDRNEVESAVDLAKNISSFNFEEKLREGRYRKEAVLLLYLHLNNKLNDQIIKLKEFIQRWKENLRILEDRAKKDKSLKPKGKSKKSSNRKDFSPSLPTLDEINFLSEAQEHMQGCYDGIVIKTKQTFMNLKRDREKEGVEFPEPFLTRYAAQTIKTLLSKQNKKDHFRQKDQVTDSGYFNLTFEDFNAMETCAELQDDYEIYLKHLSEEEKRSFLSNYFGIYFDPRRSRKHQANRDIVELASMDVDMISKGVLEDDKKKFKIKKSSHKAEKSIKASYTQDEFLKEHKKDCDILFKNTPTDIMSPIHSTNKRTEKFKPGKLTKHHTPATPETQSLFDLSQLERTKYSFAEIVEELKNLNSECESSKNFLTEQQIKPTLDNFPEIEIAHQFYFESDNKPSEKTILKYNKPIDFSFLDQIVEEIISGTDVAKFDCLERSNNIAQDITEIILKQFKTGIKKEKFKAKLSKIQDDIDENTSRLQITIFGVLKKIETRLLLQNPPSPFLLAEKEAIKQKLLDHLEVCNLWFH